MTDIQSLLNKQDFIELSARERAKALLDKGLFESCSTHLHVLCRLGSLSKILSRKPMMAW